MKIAIINKHPIDDIGGSEIQCDIIATYLTRFGHQAVYLAVNGARNTYDTTYLVIPIKNLNPFQLYQILKKVQPDVVYWRYGKKHLLTSAMVTKIVKSRFVYSLSHYSNSKAWIYTGNKPFNHFMDKAQSATNLLDIIRSCIYLLDPLISVWNYSALPWLVDGIVSLNQDFLTNLPVVKRKTVIHNSMLADGSDFYWPKPYVVWVANLKKRKNPEKYFSLAQALQDIGVDFLMVGNIQDKAYQYFADKRPIIQNFHFLGWKSVTEVNGILQGALFLVHTCEPEGFGNNFIQAWLKGKPTISLYFDPEGIIEKEEIGYFSRSFKNFVEQTRFLIENKAVRMAMGQKAQRFAKEYFDPEHNTRKLEAFLLVVCQ